MRGYRTNERLGHVLQTQINMVCRNRGVPIMDLMMEIIITVTIVCIIIFTVAYIEVTHGR